MSKLRALLMLSVFSVALAAGELAAPKVGYFLFKKLGSNVGAAAVATGVGGAVVYGAGVYGKGGFGASMAQQINSFARLNSLPYVAVGLMVAAL